MRGSTGVAFMRGSTGVAFMRGSTGVAFMRGSTGVAFMRGSTGVAFMRGSTGVAFLYETLQSHKRTRRGYLQYNNMHPFTASSLVEGGGLLVGLTRRYINIS